MKNILRKILIFLFKLEAELYIKRLRPQLIVVLGQMSRTDAKDLIVEQLRQQGHQVRGNVKGYNSELGVPLTILNLTAGFSSIFKWIQLLFNGLLRSFQSREKKTVIILEVALDNNEDVGKILGKIKVDVLVVSDFSANISKNSASSFVRMFVSGYLKNGGVAILNGDFLELSDLQLDKKNWQILTFAQSSNVDYEISNLIENATGQEFLLNGQSLKCDRFSIWPIYSFVTAKILSEEFKV